MADLTRLDWSTVLPRPTDDLAWSIQVREATTGEPLAALDPDRVLRTASVGKVFLLVEAARAIQAGEADPAEPLAWTDDEFVADSGLWHRMAARTLPLADLCLLTGAVSDNLATNVLVRRFGVEAVARTAAGYGVQHSGLLDRVRTERTPDLPWTLSVGCARELSDVMARLYRGEVVSPAVSAQVRDWLVGNVDLAGVPASWPLDPLAHGPEDEPGWQLFNKTGAISVVQADVGVLDAQGTAIAYAVLAEWGPHTGRREQVRATMNTIGRAIAGLVA